MSGYVVRCRYVQPDGVGYLDERGACVTDAQQAKVFRSMAEAWDFAMPQTGHGNDAWVEEISEVAHGPR